MDWKGIASAAIIVAVTCYMIKLVNKENKKPKNVDPSPTVIINTTPEAPTPKPVYPQVATDNPQINLYPQPAGNPYQTLDSTK